MILAIINNETNIVENAVVLDEGAIWRPPTGYYTVDISTLEVGIDWTYNPQTNEWTAPPAPEPVVNPLPVTEEPVSPSGEIGVSRV